MIDKTNITMMKTTPVITNFPVFSDTQLGP
jgi:hypothetical protein